MNMAPGYAAEIGLRDYPLQLVANKPQKIKVAGDYVVVVKAAADVTVMTDNRATITRSAGAGSPVVYNEIEVSSLVDQLVTLSLGFVGDKPPFTGGSASVGTVNVTPAIGTTLRNLGGTVCAPASRTELIGSDLTRFESIVVIPDDFVGTGYVGNAGVDASNGLPVNAGDRVVLQNRAALFFFNPTATAVTVRVIESIL